MKKPFDGVIGNLNRRMLQTEIAWMREELSKYQSAAPCEICHGARLRPEPLAVKIAGEHISQATARSVRHALAWFSTLHEKLTPQQNEIARAILKEINERLGFLNNVGLDYLDLEPHLGHALRRREPAHPPRQPDRLRPLRRALRARRALDRPPPARQ